MATRECKIERLLKFGKDSEIVTPNLYRYIYDNACIRQEQNVCLHGRFHAVFLAGPVSLSNAFQPRNHILPWTQILYGRSVY